MGRKGRRAVDLTADKRTFHPAGSLLCEEARMLIQAEGRLKFRGPERLEKHDQNSANKCFCSS